MKFEPKVEEDEDIFEGAVKSLPRVERIEREEANNSFSLFTLCMIGTIFFLIGLYCRKFLPW